MEHVPWIVLVTLAVICVFLSQKVARYRTMITSLRDEIDRLTINSKIEERRTNAQHESFIKLLTQNGALKKQVKSMQKEIASLNKLINN